MCLQIFDIVNYSFFIRSNIWRVRKNFQKIQNRAIRCIFKLDFNCLNSDLFKISKILPVAKRFTQLGCRYLKKALSNNYFINSLTREFLSLSLRSRLDSYKNKTPIGELFPIIALAYGLQTWLVIMLIGIKLFM